MGTSRPLVSKLEAKLFVNPLKRNYLCITQNERDDTYVARSHLRDLGQMKSTYSIVKFWLCFVCFCIAVVIRSSQARPKREIRFPRYLFN